MDLGRTECSLPIHDNYFKQFIEEARQSFLAISFLSHGDFANELAAHSPHQWSDNWVWAVRGYGSKMVICHMRTRFNTVAVILAYGLAFGQLVLTLKVSRTQLTIRRYGRSGITRAAVLQTITI